MLVKTRWLTLCAIGVVLSTAACAGPRGRQPAKTIVDLTYPVALGATLLRLASPTPERREAGRRMSDAILLNMMLVTALKPCIYSPRPRPYREAKHACPSGETSFAFAVAASLGEREPSSRWVAFPLAAAVGWARESNQKHTWEQVVAGAVVGTFVGHLAGQGKIRLFGHKDVPLPPPAPCAAELDNPAHEVGPGNRVAVWGTTF